MNLRVMQRKASNALDLSQYDNDNWMEVIDCVNSAAKDEGQSSSILQEYTALEVNLAGAVLWLAAIAEGQEVDLEGVIEDLITFREDQSNAA